MKDRPQKSRSDRDGIRITPRPGEPQRQARSWAAACTAAGVLAGAVWLIAPRAAVPPPAEPEPAPLQASAPREHIAASRLHSNRDESRDAKTEAPSPTAKASAASAASEEEIDAELARNIDAQAQQMLRAAKEAGETKGIAAFPLPGTNPIKLGLVVPRTYELPEGYIRHYQMTDDGRRLEPILMFSPDFDFVDDDGNPLAIPENRIVPAEMAPEGLPVRMLAMPKHPYGVTPGAH